MKRLLMKFFGVFVGFVLTASTFLVLPPVAPLAGTPAEQQSESQSPLATADQVLSEMSRTTGLPIKSSLRKMLAGRPAIQKYLTDSLHAEMTPQEWHAQEAGLRAFGLVSGDFDLEKFLTEFYTEQAAGFYDPHTKTMYIADWVEPDMQEMVLAHELTHALQDQNFGLDKFLHAARDDDDATNARQAIVEGHAMAAMLQQMLGPVDLATLSSVKPWMARGVDEQLSKYPTFANAPFFFRLQALFPYLQGMDFIQYGLHQGGWKKLNTLFTDPPSTTKELFEPEIYFEHKLLPKVSLPRPEALSGVAGLRLLAENSLGELGYYALLGQLISEDEAQPVATTWLADRYILYEYAGKPPAEEKYALVSRTKWSSAEKAQAFFRDYHTILQKKYPGLAPDARPGADLFIGGVGPNRVVLIRTDDEVRWAEGIPAGQADGMVKYLNSLQ